MHSNDIEDWLTIYNELSLLFVLSRVRAELTDWHIQVSINVLDLSPIILNVFFMFASGPPCEMLKCGAAVELYT